MKLKLRHKAPVVFAAALAMTAASGAAAFALVSSHEDDVTGVGNTLPIDDNHASMRPTPTHTPEPGDDNGVHATGEPGDDNGGRGEVEPGDDHGVHATGEPGDDNGVHATGEPGDDNGGNRGTGSDDATPAPARSADDRRGSNSGSDDGSASSSGRGGGGSDDSGSDDSGGHGSGK